MKNRKLFAILTLAVFMMTLLPMAAFAAAVAPTAMTASVSNNASGATTDLTLNFTVPATAAGDTITIDFTDNADVAAAVLAGGAANAVGSSAEFTGAIQAGNSQIVLTATGAPAGTYTQVVSGLTNLSAGAYKVKVGATTLATYSVGTANPYASSYSLDQNSVPATASDKIVAEVLVADGNNVPLSGAKVIVTTSRIGTDTVTTKSDYTANTTNASGKVEFEIGSTIQGTSKVAVALELPLNFDPDGAGPKPQIANRAAQITAIQNYLNGDTTYTATDLQILGYETVTFTSPSATGVTLTADAGATISDGVTEKSVVATVTGTGGAPVQGATVEFAANKSGLVFDKESYTTDAFGRVTAKVTTTKAGVYTITASSAGHEDSADYTFAASSTAYMLEKVAGDEQLTATTFNSGKMKVKVTDVNGNVLKGATATSAVRWEIKTKPSNSNLSKTRDAALWTEGWDGDSNTVTGVFAPDKDGTYVVRASLSNGKYVDFTLEAKEQGKIVELTMEYDQKSIGIPNGQTGQPTVKWVDAAGVKRDATVTSLTFSSSNPMVATVNNAGGATTHGIVSVATTDTKKAQTITITAVDQTRNLVASTTIDVVTDPVALQLSVDKDKIAVGEKGVVTVQLVDENGKPVAFTYDTAKTPVVTIKVISRPSLAALDTSVASNAATTLEETGKTTFTASSVVEGEYKVQVLVQDNAGATNVFTDSIDLTFVKGKADVEYGAKNVTMFIGSVGFVKDGAALTMDQAPFIQDNRTFVPVRMVGEALGAEVEFDAATQVITLTREDMTITMTVGSNVLTKDDGTTVVADVAPFIVAETGRTVIPFRAIAEAFGATVEAVFAADGTVNAVTFQQ